MGEILDDLDISAKVNLNKSDLDEYYRYKQKLIRDGEPEEEIRQILSGFIWDVTEYYD